MFTRKSSAVEPYSACHFWLLLAAEESITGYNYEPWHIRYVGIDIAKEISERGITLEVYFQDAVPVNK